MEWIYISFTVIIVCIAALTIKQYRPEFSTILGLCAGTLIIAMIVREAEPLIILLKDLVIGSGVASETMTILLKVLGVCIISEFACDTCKNAGEQALAGVLDIGAKITALLISVPLFEAVSNIAVQLLEV